MTASLCGTLVLINLLKKLKTYISVALDYFSMITKVTAKLF